MTKTTETVRVAVVGAGRMGQNHLRIYDFLKDVTIAGVVDTDRATAEDMAGRYGCPVFDSIEQLVGKVDAVSVCVPSALHGDVGQFLLGNGIHCLIEKPLATTEAECLSLIGEAARTGVALMVGHVERFNPAVQQLAHILDGGRKIYAIDARRMSWASSRVTDVDVVLDLMVHDLDVVLSFVRRPVSSVVATGVHAHDSLGEDYVSAILGFSTGTMATLTASRITQTKVRELSLTTDIGHMTIDYINQQLLVYRRGPNESDGDMWWSEGGYVLDNVVDRVLIRNQEPLLLELQSFIDAVQRGMKPLVTGEEALAALQLAWQIQEQVKNAGPGEGIIRSPMPNQARTKHK